MTKRKHPPGIRVEGKSWWTDFTLHGVRDRRRVGPVGSLTIDDVEKIRAVRIGDAVRGAEGIAPTRQKAITLSILRSRYLDALPANSERLTHARTHFAHFLRLLGGDTPVDRLSHVGLMTYRTQRQRETVASDGRADKARREKREAPLVKPSTVSRELSTLRRALAWAKGEGHEVGRGGSVFDRLDRAGRRTVFPPEPPSAPAVLNDEDVEAICGHLAPPYQRLVKFLFLTGMRLGEALALRWDYVADRERVPHVLLRKTKSGRPRQVPLSDRALAVLRQCPKTSDFVFTGSTGRPIQNVGRAWGAARKASGRPRARLHDLRHSFASHFIELGGDVAALRDVCGWRDLTIPSRYVHSSSSRALDVLNAPPNARPRQTAVKPEISKSA